MSFARHRRTGMGVTRCQVSQGPITDRMNRIRTEAWFDLKLFQEFGELHERAQSRTG